MDPAPALPAAEIEFARRVEGWYERQGVSRHDPLFEHWVTTGTRDTYVAGRRVARELSLSIDLEGLRVLDVGCGFGGALLAMSDAGARAIGLEYADDSLQVCRERLALHGVTAALVRGNAFALPFPDQAFDVVVSMEVLEHVPRRAAFIAELARVLRPGGMLYLSFPNLFSWTNLVRDPHYQLAGVTAMPLPIARWYTRRRRGWNYDVQVLPIGPWVARRCARNGVRMYSLVTSEKVLLERVSAPWTIRDPVPRKLLSTVHRLGLAGVARAAVRVRAAFGPTAVLTGFKE
jgi:2-polyprenyl-3-methyl-5-hydroxy-6-metoxy-1,4-benzoquinol methylase